MRIAKSVGIRRLFSVAFGVLVFATLVAVTSSALAIPVRAGSVTPMAVAAQDAPRSIGVIVRFKQPSNAPLAAQLLSAITSSTAQPTNAKRGLYVFRTPETQTDDLYSVQLMLAASSVAWAEPNYVRHIDTYVAPTDPDYNSTEIWSAGTDYYLGAKHWWQTALNASGAWAIGEGSTYPVHGTPSSVKVAVIDTGMYLSHPEFTGGTVTGGVDECASYNPVTDVLTTDFDVTPDATTEVYYQSHGTAVTAAVGAEVNGVGTVGSGWNPQIVGYKVAGPLTSAWDGSAAGDLVIVDSAAVNGIYDAVAAGCKVINLSLGSPDFSQAYQDAITYAHSQGVVVCASAGNDGSTAPQYPAGCTYATGIGAVQRSGGSTSVSGTITWWSDSNYAPGVVDLVAPGTMIWSAIKPGYLDPYSDTEGYTFWDGTSFSSPAVAGSIAYLWRAMPDLTNDQIVTYMENSATDMGTAGRDNYYGYGLVNMQAAYNKLITDYPTLAKPSIAASSTVRSGSSVSWGASSGYSVNYQVSIDGSLRSTQTGTSYVLPALSDGQHLIAVLPTSARNWNTSSLATKTLTLDSTAPSVSSFRFADTSVNWSIAESSAYSVQAYVDSGSPTTVVGNTLDVSGLATGSHTVHVNATDALGNSSGWVTWTFDCALTLSVPNVTVTDTVSAAVVWTPVLGAASYDYTIDGGSVLNTVGPGFEIAPLPVGVTPLQVRARTASGTAGEWVAATITNNIIVPDVPSPSAPSTVTVPSVSVTWPAAANAHFYEYRLNGGVASSTAALGTTVSGLMVGANTVGVRSSDNLAQSEWATVTVTYVPPAPTTLGLARTTSRITYPTSAVTLIGQFAAPAEHAAIQSSVDGGVTWLDTGSGWTTAATPSPTAVAVGISRNTRYRAVFAGDFTWAAAVSPVVSVDYAPQVKTPSTPSSVRRNRKFTTAITLIAPVRDSAATVTLRYLRYQKVRGKYTWVLRKSVRVRGVASGSNALIFRTSQSLSIAGTWHVVAVSSAGSRYVSATSPARSLRVR